MEYAACLSCLHNVAQLDYAAFQKRIASDTAYPILGVRMPVLRKLAKQAAANGWQSFLRTAGFESYEEVMLCGLLIAYAPVELSRKLPVLRQYLPMLDSWALTDSIAPTLTVSFQELELLWQFSQECIADTHTYSVRFGIVLMLRFFLTEDRIPQVAACLTAIDTEEYYIRMAVAWCLAEMAVYDYAIVENILQNNLLDKFTHQKTIQKMRESFRFTKEQKAAIGLLRRK